MQLKYQKKKKICAVYGEGTVTDRTCQKWLVETSGQEGGIGRYTLPPHTTKRRATTNLKIKN